MGTKASNVPKYILTFIICFCLQYSVVQAAPPAQWITAFRNQSATNSWLCFRNEFVVNNLDSTLWNARIAADSKYWVWINDSLVVFEGAVKRGPTPYDTYVDVVNLKPYIKTGKNTVVVLLWYFGKQGFSYNPSGMAGLYIDCPSLKTDKTWLSAVHPAYYTPQAPFPNFRLSESNIGYDARFTHQSWNDYQSIVSSFSWKYSLEKGPEGTAPWNKLEDRMIPMWKNYGLKNYIKQELRVGKVVDTLVCSLPYNAQITPYLEVKSIEGQKITICTDNYQGGGAYNVRAEYITCDGNQQYESFGWMNGHEVYYIFVKGIEIIDVKYRETGYDTEFVGNFTCNDVFYNQLWKKAQRTLYVNMRDTYMDCPDRERAQWWGDVVNQSVQSYYSFCPKSHKLTRKGMYELIHWQRSNGVIYSPIPTSNYVTELPGQMLASIGEFGFWNYYLYTGDIEPIRDLYAGIGKYLSVWEKENNGILRFRSGDWTWGDWGTNIDIHGIFNAWYYIALQGRLKMANVLNKPDDAIAIKQEMNALKIAFNLYFWNNNAYRTPDYQGETDDRLQALAVLSGLADQDKYPALFEIFKTQEYASPYMEKYVLEALMKINQPHYALFRMKKRFTPMVTDEHCSTLYEGWGKGKEGFEGDTYNHGWSGGGLTILSQYVCGIAPIQPGFDTFTVLPQLGGLTDVQTNLETVNGDINVWVSTSINIFKLKVTAPSKTKVIMGVPQSGVKTIKLNGKLIYSKQKNLQHKQILEVKESNQFITYKLPAGNWTLTATY